jgi:hypothetical protein
MELVDSFGQTTQLRFSKLQRNPSLDPATFRFTTQGRGRRRGKVMPGGEAKASADMAASL